MCLTIPCLMMHIYELNFDYLTWADLILNCQLKNENYFESLDHLTLHLTLLFLKEFLQLLHKLLRIIPLMFKNHQHSLAINFHQANHQLSSWAHSTQNIVQEELKYLKCHSNLIWHQEHLISSFHQFYPVLPLFV